MSAETIRQIDLFSGEVVDNRTRAQKQAAREREKPQQTEMFAQREIAQFGVRANPHLSLSEHTKLVLVREDPRSEEEIERDRVREAQMLTVALFSVHNQEVPISNSTPKDIRPDQHQSKAIIGYRVLARQRRIKVRRRY
jgi:hypothetical protein